MWRVESQADGSFFQAVSSGGEIGDPDTVAAIDSMRRRPVPMGPGLGVYTPTGPADPVWLWFAALAAVPTPHTITGSPPPINPAPAAHPTDAVF